MFSPTRIVLTALVLGVAVNTPLLAASSAGKDFDLQGFVDKAVAGGAKKIVLPPGKYRVKPIKGHHLFLKDLSDVVIDATGAELICTQTTRAITMRDCRNVTLRGLSIDYDPLPFTEGKIVSQSPDKSQIEVELFDGYPNSAHAIKFKVEIFDPTTRLLRTHDYDWANIEKISPSRVRLTKTSEGGEERVGDIVVMANEDSPDGQVAHGVVLEKCVGVRLENITLWSSNCFGFFETYCESTTYFRCRIDRRDPLSDFVKRAYPRMRSLNADAYHSKHAVKGPSLIECSAGFMGDDAVNICGDYNIITEGSGDTYRVLIKDAPLAEGDVLELFTYEGVRLPDVKLVKIEPDGEINAKEREFLLRQRMDEGLRTRWTPKACRITLERPVPLTWFSAVASTRAMGNGFVVRNCKFGHNRSRGILIKASQGQIVGNTVEGSWMTAISISPEYWWLESGSSNDLEIRGNTIRDVKGRAISVDARAGNGEIAPSGAHNRISIIGNTISGSPAPQISVTSTAALRIERNTITPFEPGKSIEVIQCDSPTIK